MYGYVGPQSLSALHALGPMRKTRHVAVYQQLPLLPFCARARAVSPRFQLYFAGPLSTAVRLLKEGGLLNPDWLDSSVASRALQSRAHSKQGLVPMNASTIPDLPSVGVALAMEYKDYYEAIMLVSLQHRSENDSFFFKSPAALSVSAWASPGVATSVAAELVCWVPCCAFRCCRLSALGWRAQVLSRGLLQTLSSKRRPLLDSARVHPAWTSMFCNVSRPSLLNPPPRSTAAQALCGGCTFRALAACYRLSTRPPGRRSLQ